MGNRKGGDRNRHSNRANHFPRSCFILAETSRLFFFAGALEGAASELDFWGPAADCHSDSFSTGPFVPDVSFLELFRPIRFEEELFALLAECDSSVSGRHSITSSPIVIVLLFMQILASNFRKNGIPSISWYLSIFDPST
jgi:hypothetical protein